MKTSSTLPNFWIVASLFAGALAPAAGALTADEGLTLLYMKQEEKLARDVYQALGARWEHPTFLNITRSEQRHLEAIEALIQRFGLSDATPVEPGRFTYPDLQALYDRLVLEGAASLTAALQAGVQIEEADIADLEEALAQVREPVVQRVFTQLLKASGHHLAAFNAALARGGTVDALSCPGAGAGSGACGAQAGAGPQAGRRGKGPGPRAGAGACLGMNGQGTCAQAGPGAGTCLQRGPEAGTGTGTGTGTGNGGPQGNAQRRGRSQ